MQHNAYLNFEDQTEEAFRFYAAALGTEVEMLTRFGDMPAPGVPLPDEEARKVMHVRVPLGNGQWLMGSDMFGPMGKRLVVGNNFYVSLHPETREEGERLFAALSDGGEVEAPFAPAPWGAHWGAFRDRFGVQWMVNWEVPRE